MPADKIEQFSGTRRSVSVFQVYLHGHSCRGFSDVPSLLVLQLIHTEFYRIDRSFAAFDKVHQAIVDTDGALNPYDSFFFLDQYNGSSFQTPVARIAHTPQCSGFPGRKILTLAAIVAEPTFCLPAAKDDRQCLISGFIFLLSIEN